MEIVLVQVRQGDVLQRDGVGGIERDHHVAADLGARGLNGREVGEQAVAYFDHVVAAGTRGEVGDGVEAEAGLEDECFSYVSLDSTSVTETATLLLAPGTSPCPIMRTAVLTSMWHVSAKTIVFKRRTFRQNRQEINSDPNYSSVIALLLRKPMQRGVREPFCEPPVGPDADQISTIAAAPADARAGPSGVEGARPSQFQEARRA